MTVLLIDSREKNALRLADALLCRCLVVTCKTGREALTVLQKYCPDVTVVCYPMPEDTLDFLSQVKTRYPEGKLVVSTRLRSPYFLRRLERIGVSMVLPEPWRKETAAGHICALGENMESTPEETLWHRTGNLLRNLGVPPGHRGFAVLREAVVGKIKGKERPPESRRGAAEGLARAREEGKFWSLAFPRETPTASRAVEILSARLLEELGNGG